MTNEVFGLDTSVVLRLLVGTPVSQAERALAFLQTRAASGRPCMVNDLVVTEAYYALHAHYEVPKKEALLTLRAFLNSALVTASSEALASLEEMTGQSSKPGFVDRLIHHQYQSHSTRLVTFEKKASKLSETTVL